MPPVLRQDRKRPNAGKDPHKQTSRKARKIASTERKAASDAVFNITELLERVLEHLSWKQLFVCQRVCRPFQQVISQSTPLRQRMVLFHGEQADPDPEQLPHALKVLGRKIVKPGPYARLPSGQRVCPLLEPQDPFNSWKAPRPRPIVYALDALAGKHGTSGSWREVFLADPPVTELKFNLEWRIKRAGYLRSQGRIRHTEALTLGKFFEMAMNRCNGPYQGHTHAEGNVNDSISSVKCDTAEEVLFRLERRLGCQADLDGESSWVEFDFSVKGPSASN